MLTKVIHKHLDEINDGHISDNTHNRTKYYCAAPQWQRLIATDRVARSVCLCVGHIREPCKNGWTDRDVVWEAELGGPKEPYIG